MKEVKSPKKPLIFYYGIALLVIVLFNVIVSPLLVKARVTEVDYGTFMSMIEQKKIGNVEVDDDQIIFTDKDDAKKIYKTGAMNDPTLTQRLYDSGAKFSKDIETTTSPLVSFLLTFVLPLIIFIGLGQYMGKKLMEQAGGKNSMAFGFGKSNAKVYVPSTQGIHFSDVAGEDEAKESLSEIVDYLHNPKKYSDVGASMPKGVLLVGPPGTGKTMLAKAVAGEANVPFFSMSGSEFVEMFVGMGASKVRDLFSQAKEKAPCIVFIDEIDAIGKKRDGQFSSNDEREQTLNQLLTEMDGFQENIGVIILAATNRPETLDPALTRPGRFDRRVPVELPDLAGREAILKVHAKKIKTADDVNFHTIARMASGASGAELANIINEAALRAVRDHRTQVTQAELNTPSRSTPLCMPLTWAMDWLSSSLLLSIWRMDGSRLSAAAVIVTPLLVRVNSGNPHSDSMPETAWLMAEGVRCICSAAAAKVPSWATMLNSWQSVSVMSCISCGEKNSCDV